MLKRPNTDVSRDGKENKCVRHDVRYPARNERQESNQNSTIVKKMFNSVHAHSRERISVVGLMMKFVHFSVQEFGMKQSVSHVKVEIAPNSSSYQPYENLWCLGHFRVDFPSGSYHTDLINTHHKYSTPGLESFSDNERRRRCLRIVFPFGFKCFH